MTGLADKADRACKGQIARALSAAAFTGRRDSSLDIVAPGGGLGRVVVFGLGDPAKLTGIDVEMLGGAVAGDTAEQKAKSATVAADISPKGLSEADFAALIGSGARLRVYSFGHYKSKKPESGGLADLTILSSDAAAAGRHFRRSTPWPRASILPVTLSTNPQLLSPGRVCKPHAGADQAWREGRDPDPAQMKRLGMGALLGVAQGSTREARLVIMRWDGGPQGGSTAAFIGKGVTFDTGGIRSSRRAAWRT